MQAEDMDVAMMAAEMAQEEEEMKSLPLTS